MSPRTFEKLARVACLAAIVIAPSCGGADDAGAPPVARQVLPESYWLAAAPQGALDVKQARETSANGVEIVVVGRVGDLLDTRAQFQLVDRSFTACSDRPEDECETPWDFCCEEPTELSQGTLVVECRDGDRLRKVTAAGFHGLDHLEEVVVRGTAIKDDAGNLILVADGIHVRG
jgi:hypothetical protein